MSQEGFVNRVQREAQEEVERVLADLARLRFRADQVAHVLRALNLPVPDEVTALLGGPRFEAGTASATVVQPTPEEATAGGHEVFMPERRAPAEPSDEPAPGAREGDVPGPGPAAAAPSPPPRKGVLTNALNLSQGQLTDRVLKALETGPATVNQIAERASLTTTPTSLNVVLNLIGKLRRSGRVRLVDQAAQTYGLPGSGETPQTSERPKGSRYAGDENRAAIVAWLQEHGPTQLGVLVKGVGLSQTVVSRHLKVLIAEGGVERTGTTTGKGRHAPGYKAAAQSDPSPAPPTSADTAADTGGAESDSSAEPTTETPRGERLEQVARNVVRGEMVRLNGQHAPVSELARSLGLPVEVAEKACEQLFRAGVLLKRGTNIYALNKDRPQGPGRAAEADAARRAAGTNGVVREPVAGTGRQTHHRVADEHVRRLLEDVKKAGGSYEGADGHFNIYAPDGRFLCQVRGTPSGNPRIEVGHDRARLRRKGLSV